MSAGLRHWPRRRWLLATGAFPALVLLFAAAGTGSLAGTTASWWIWPWLVLNSAVASVVVASYLAFPGRGKIIDIGCSPCAAVAGLALVAAFVAHSNAPASPAMAVAASALTAFALRQRLANADSCPTPPWQRARSSSPQSAASAPATDDQPSPASSPAGAPGRPAGASGRDAAAESMLKQ